MLLQIPIQYLLGQIYIKLRLKAAKYTDKRIVVMNEVISGIRVIKMYGWEYAFHGLVAKIRKKEIRITLLSSIIRSINLSYYAISLPTILFVVFSVYINIDESNTLSAKKLFTTFSFLASVRLLLSFLVTGIIYLHEAKAGAKRIKNLLTLNEHEIVHKGYWMMYSINKLYNYCRFE
jgi:ATP-binding cassette subfamily C (CFTR/MRP) protein 4